MNFYEYCQKHVDNFNERFQVVLSIVDRERCSFEHADSSLWDDIYDAANDYCDDFGLDFCEFDIEEELFKD